MREKFVSLHTLTYFCILLNFEIMIIFLKKACICLLVSLCFMACGDQDLLKFGNLEGVKNWEPDYTLNLAYANYDVWKLIEQTNSEDSTVIQRENQIYIRHYQKSILSLDVKDVIELPRNIAHFSLHASLPSGIGQLPGDQIFDFPEDTVPFAFTEGLLTKVYGSLNCRYELPQLSFKYTLAIEFGNILLSSGEPVRFTLSESDQPSGVINLQDILLDMSSSPNQLVWKVSIIVPGGEKIDVNELNMGMDLMDLSFTRLEGKMKTQEVEIEEDHFNMNVEFWENFDGSFNFANPKIDLIVRNYGLAVPVQMDMHFEAYGDNKRVALETKNNYKPAFDGWIPDEGMREEIQGYNVTNSNIAELLSLPPKDKIAYSGKIIISPDPEKTVTILADGKADADACVEIPLHLSAKNLVFNDTIDDIDISDADKIKAAKITVRAVNQIPLGLGKGYLYLLDEAKNCIDSVVVERFLDAPDLNSAGEVIVPGEKKEAPSIILSERNILHLDDTKYIVISVEAATSKEGEVPVIIKADATLKLELLLGVKLNLEDIF